MWLQTSDSSAKPKSANNHAAPCAIRKAKEQIEKGARQGAEYARFQG
jgi:hypothetical protein